MSNRSMRAMVRRGNALEVVDVAEPIPGPGQLVAATRACGICGSDLHAVHHLETTIEMSRRSGAANTIDPSQDLVMGHEFCAEVLEYGSGANKRFKPGALVVSPPFNLGPNGTELIGFSSRFKGAFAERVILTEAMCIQVPNGMKAEHAALTEPLAVGTHAVAVGAPTKQSVALVVGCGPIGLAVITALKRRGIGPIIASDFSPRRRARAERLGADIVVDPAKNSPHDHWNKFDVPATLAELSPAMLAGRNVRDAIIFECVGVPGMISSLVFGAPPKSHIVVVGACMESDSFVPVIAINKQLRLDFVFAYSGPEFAETLNALANGEIEFDAFLTDTVSLNEAPHAFETLSQPQDHVKIMVEPWR